MSKTAICVLTLFLTACGSGHPKPGGEEGPKHSASFPSSSSVSAGSILTGSSSSSSAGSGDANGAIVVDQFGYLPEARKIAVLRAPQIGFDSKSDYVPSNKIQLKNVSTGQVVLESSAETWSNGDVDELSGDKAWWFDFSSVNTPGRYLVVDSVTGLSSAPFTIGTDIYEPVLKAAMRTFYYQRSGFAKVEPFAEKGWVDGASHVGPGQDKNARLYSDKQNPHTEKDLSGGWYDAGDYNKYTNWHADYIITLLHAYLENKAAWGDDYDIPESGNGVPDIIDEIVWGLDWLKKMQNSDGSLLSILASDPGSPPSAAKGPSYYGPASTSASLSGAATFAFASKVLGEFNNPALKTYSADLKTRAEQAWDWAKKNPNVTFRNNEGDAVGLGGGQQEVDGEGLKDKRQKAANHLMILTGNAKYAGDIGNVLGYGVYGIWDEPMLTNSLYFIDNYKDFDAVTARLFKGGQSYNMLTSPYGGNHFTEWKKGPYMAWLADYMFDWGSNRAISRAGVMAHFFLDYGIPYKAHGIVAQDVKNHALGYLNYLHGVNPLGLVYLSNMNSLGATKSVSEFYHQWFANGSALWDKVGESTYGPAPGFLVGGPNINYKWDAVCEAATPHKDCGKEKLSPPFGQPPMKSYREFNTSWPINSWEVTENHNDYQVAYIRLLSKFVN